MAKRNAKAEKEVYRSTRLGETNRYSPSNLNYFQGNSLKNANHLQKESELQDGNA